jgi:outer membrane protein TolC
MLRIVYKIFKNSSIVNKGVGRLILLLMLIGAGSASIAQQADSLSGYLKEAGLHNPGLKAKYSQYLAALEKIPQAGALPDPELQLGFFITPMELLGGNQLANIRLMQMSPWFGTLKAAKDEASKMALARYQEMLSVKNDLYLEVRSSWYQIFRITREIEITQENLQLLKSLERMALVRFRAAESSASSAPAGMEGGNDPAPKSGSSGMTSGSMGKSNASSGANSSAMPASSNPAMGSASQGGMVNLLRVQIEIGSMENNIALLQDQLKTAKVRFNSYLNRKPESEVYVNDSLMEAELPASLVSLSDSIANNPMIRMYQADQAANESRIAMSKKMGYPMVGIGLDYSVIQKRPDGTSMMNGRDMIMPMLTATLPIYRKKYTALRREAEFLRDAAGESASNVKNELVVNYQEAIDILKDAERRTELYKRQSSLAGKTLALLTASFSTAGSDFEEILRMQQQLLDYRFKLIEALVDRNTAIAQLLSIISYN